MTPLSVRASPRNVPHCASGEGTLRAPFEPLAAGRAPVRALEILDAARTLGNGRPFAFLTTYD